MNTRFALVAGTLVIGIAVSAALIQPPQPPSLTLAGKDLKRPAGPALVKPSSLVAVERPALALSGGEVRADLFTRPVSEQPASPKQPEMQEQPGENAPEPAHPAPDKFADYVYSGTITASGHTIALLENSRTHTGGYYQQGDLFQDAKVVQVDADGVTLDVHGAKRRLPKSDVYNLVPLNAAAPEPPPAVTAMNSQAVAFQATVDQATALRMLTNNDGAMQFTDLNGTLSEALPAVVDRFEVSTFNP